MELAKALNHAHMLLLDNVEHALVGVVHRSMLIADAPNQSTYDLGNYEQDNEGDCHTHDDGQYLTEVVEHRSLLYAESIDYESYRTHLRFLPTRSARSMMSALWVLLRSNV